MRNPWQGSDFKSNDKVKVVYRDRDELPDNYNSERLCVLCGSQVFNVDPDPTTVYVHRDCIYCPEPIHTDRDELIELWRMGLEDATDPSE